LQYSIKAFPGDPAIKTGDRAPDRDLNLFVIAYAVLAIAIAPQMAVGNGADVLKEFSMGSSSRFNCSNCGAAYEVVHVEAENVANDCELACLSCGAPLQSRQGRFVLKYFLVKRSYSAVTLRRPESALTH
jgi:predicted nucleic acid-binding Zn ribbon protein